MAVSSAHTGRSSRSAAPKPRAGDKRASQTFIGILLLTLTIFGWWVIHYNPIGGKAHLEDEKGKAKSISNIFMASTLCKKQAALNFQGSLVSAIVDDFSTRYDRPRDLFVVLLFVSVYQPGKVTEEYRTHCHVTPNDTEVHYYRGFAVSH